MDEKWVVSATFFPEPDDVDLGECSKAYGFTDRDEAERCLARLQTYENFLGGEILPIESWEPQPDWTVEEVLAREG
jgi:hypothetical protein